MSRWKDEFDAHPIHVTLQEFRDMTEATFENMDSQETPEKRRMLKIVSTYEDTLKKLDPELVPMDQLTALNSGLRAAALWNQMTSYVSSGNVAHLTSANNQLSSQLTPLALLLSIAKRTAREIPLRGLEKAVDEMSESLIAKKDDIVGKYDTLSDTLDGLQKDVTKLEASVETRRTETDAQLSKWQQQFSDSQERRGTDFTSWREETDKQAKDLLKTIEADTREATGVIEEHFATEADEMIADAREKHKAILELYELTAGDSVGAGYSQNADIEKKQANFWRWSSIIFILVTASWLFYSYSNSAVTEQPAVKLATATKAVDVAKEKDPALAVNVQVDSGDREQGVNWLKLLAALSLTGVLLFGAAYSSQQSNHHRKNERRARRFALQMKAFDPFINSLESGVQAELKQELSQKLFGSVDENNEHDGRVIDEHALKVVTKSIVEILDKAQKS